MADMLVVGSKVKAYIKSKGCHTSSDTVEALSKEVEKLLDKAAARAKANNHGTVKPRDL